MSRHAAVRAVRSQAKRAAAQARNVHRADVVDTSPLKVEMAGDVLEAGEDFELTASADAYDEDEGIGTDDSLLLMRDGDDWIAFDVVPGKTRSSKSLARRVADLEDRVKELENA